MDFCNMPLSAFVARDFCLTQNHGRTCSESHEQGGRANHLKEQSAEGQN